MLQSIAAARLKRHRFYDDSFDFFYNNFKKRNSTFVYPDFDSSHRAGNSWLWEKRKHLNFGAYSRRNLWKHVRIFSDTKTKGKSFFTKKCKKRE